MKIGRVEIVEVGPRDGLQNESRPVDLKTRYELVRRLSLVGLKEIEVGAFVSPKWVPQMADTGPLVQRVLEAQKDGEIEKQATFSVLVPNVQGMNDALQTGIKKVAIFGACSESFSKRNINCSIDESFERFEQIMILARKHKVKVRGYLSTAFGCPYEGAVKESKVVRLVDRMLKLGVYQVSVGDTIGVATPKQVESLTKKIKAKTGLQKVALHFHDTRGTALANVLAGLQAGVRTFDASVGGLGGCPYAPGASGNLATEDLAYMLSGMGVKTGIDLKGLIEIKKWLDGVFGRTLPSRVGQSGLPLAGTIF